MPARTPLSTLLSHVLVSHAIEVDNEFERRFVATGANARITSLVMWSNFLRFVGDGITVGELPAAVGLPKARVLSTLGGMERWRYVAVGAGKGKRDGYGSSRALRPEWTVRPTDAGRAAASLWPAALRDVERRRRRRFGAAVVDELTEALRAIVSDIDLELPAFVPILGSSDGMVAGLDPPGPRVGKPPRGPVPLLSQALLAYTLEFEREADVSLALSATVLRVLDGDGLLVRDLPRAAGTSPEAIAIALTALGRSGHLSVRRRASPTTRVRLSAKGSEAQKRAQRVHGILERRWAKRFDVPRLRSALEQVLEQRDALSAGLEPPEGGWRASKPYAERTAALVADPVARLPHYPVLYRGGWPDGS